VADYHFQSYSSLNLLHSSHFPLFQPLGLIICEGKREEEGGGAWLPLSFLFIFEPFAIIAFPFLSTTWISYLRRKKGRRSWRCLITTFSLIHLWTFCIHRISLFFIPLDYSFAIAFPFLLSPWISYLRRKTRRRRWRCLITTFILFHLWIFCNHRISLSFNPLD